MRPWGSWQRFESIKPDVLIESTMAAPGMFHEGVVRKMAEFNEQPVIFALSNCNIAAQSVQPKKRTILRTDAVHFLLWQSFETCGVERWLALRRPGQGTDAYVYPGIGLGALAANSRVLPEAFCLTAAHALAEFVRDEDLQFSTLYPQLRRNPGNN